MPEPSASEPAPAPPPGLDRTPLDLAPAPGSPDSPPADAAAKPTPAPGAGAAAAPAAPATPADLDRSSAISRPAGAIQMAALPPLDPAPPLNSVPVTATARVTAPEPASPRRDAQIIRVSALKPAADGSPGPSTDRKASDRKRLALEPGVPLAKVGDEIITYHDFTIAWNDTIKRMPELVEALQQGVDTAEFRHQVRDLRIQTLNSLIDRSMLVQEAKHILQGNKDPKVLDRISEQADQVFRESEIEPLLKKENLTESQLNERFVKEGQSLEAKRQAFRQLFLSENYLHEKLRDWIKVELPDLLKYYNDHVKKHEFDRPAQITWRELVVEVAKHPNSEAARKKAVSLLERLSRGEDFRALARAESDGPSRSRNQGGLMQTSPEGYGVAAVNAALKSLPIGQISGVIAGPESFHVVRVEGRRPAGPASFEEVQDQIGPVVADAKFRGERTAYLAKLRRRTLVTLYNVKRTKKPQDENLSTNQMQVARGTND